MNVSRPCCGVLVWSALEECVQDVTYRIRLFSGHTYWTTPTPQKTIMYSKTSSLYFTAEYVPNGRPLYAIVSCTIKSFSTVSFSTVQLPVVAMLGVHNHPLLQY